MLRHHTGRPGTEVIPADWATNHRPVAEKTMVGATVQLRHLGTTQAWSDADQQMVEVPLVPYYDGPARVQALATRNQSTVTAGDRVVTIRYLVVVPADVDSMVDDLVTVTVVDDAHMLGRSLMVAQVTSGSVRWERDLGCVLTD